MADKNKKENTDTQVYEPNLNKIFRNQKRRRYDDMNKKSKSVPKHKQFKNEAKHKQIKGVQGDDVKKKKKKKSKDKELKGVKDGKIKKPKNKQKNVTSKTIEKRFKKDKKQFNVKSKDGPKQRYKDLKYRNPGLKLQNFRHNRDKPKEDEKENTSGRKVDPYPGKAPIPKERLDKYRRTKKEYLGGMRSVIDSKKALKTERRVNEAVMHAARAEALLTEQPGFLELDEGEEATRLTQHEIAREVDITSAQKYFELKLSDFGPYRADYTRNGRHLLLAGGQGHVAALDWQTKKLHCEFNAMETVSDAKWLHIETMFAVAQREWIYIYDNQGIELHCLKIIDRTLKMEFLPYHFLLAAANAKGYISWLDVSIGQKVGGYATGQGRLDVMCQNPTNAIVHLGHVGGTVTLWSPNVKEPLVKMLCHGGATRGLAVDNTGRYMATSGVDRKLKIWDLRKYQVVHEYKIGGGAGSLAFSQKGLLAAGIGNTVEVYQDPCRQVVTSPYLQHQCQRTIANCQFCPYEDVLGAGHGDGFSSMLVPGAGEPNFDAMEANPFQTKKQRRHAEVSMLLQKVQPDLITLDTRMLGRVDRKTYEEKVEERNKLLFLKPEKLAFEPKYKKKGRSKTGKKEQRKRGVQEEAKRDFVKQQLKEKEEASRKQKKTNKLELGDSLSRFKKKKNT